MDVVEELKSLLKKWEDIANKAWNDHYSDAMWNCYNDIQAIIDNQKIHPIKTGDLHIL